MATHADSSAAVPGTHRRFPDFFIVGHHKCGTTALWHALRRHPQIFMPNFKEPRFFATDLRQRFETPRGRRGMFYRPVRTLEEYLALFEAAAPEQLVGEASAGYLWSHTAAERIAAAQPGARIIAILREPASFLRSLHLQFLRGHQENAKSLRRAMALEDVRRQGRRIPRRSTLPQMLQYSEHLRYVEQLRRYHACFPPEHVLVLIYESFRADNEGTVRSVLRFLGVGDDFPIEITDANPTNRAIRSQGLDDLLDRATCGRGAAGRAMKATVKALTPRDLRRQTLATVRRRLVFGKPPAPDEEFMFELRRRYKPEVVAVSEYLGRDLVSLWGYDRVG